MVDPVNNSSVSGSGQTHHAEGTGSVDNNDRPPQSNDQTVTTSHRPSGPEEQVNPYLDDFDADESAIGRGLFASEAMNPDIHTELIMTVQQTIQETVQDLAENDDDMRMQAEENMRSDADDREDSIRDKAKQAEAGAVSSSIIRFTGSFAEAFVGVRGIKSEKFNIELTGRDALPVAQGISGAFDATAGIDKAIIDKGVTDKEADEVQLESDYNIDTSQTQHASSAFDSDMNVIKQAVQAGCDAMKENEQTKRQEFNV